MKRSSIIVLLTIFLFTTVFVACSDDSGISDSLGYSAATPITDPDFLAFFNPTIVHTIDIVFTGAEWSNLSNDLQKTSFSWAYGRNGTGFSTEICRKATIVVDGTSIADSGVRIRGNTSRYFPRDANGFHWVHWKVSFSQDFAEDESVYGSSAISTVIKTVKTKFGVRGLNLKHHSADPSGVKEAFGYDLARRFGLPVPYYTFAKVNVVVNGVTNNFGLYEVFEPIDKQFIRLRFGGASSYLFKCLWNDGGPASLTTDLYIKEVDIGLEKKDPATPAEAVSWDPDPDWNPSVIPTGRPYTPTYDMKAKTQDLSVAAGILDTLIQGITTKSGAEFNSWIDSVIDVDTFLRFAAFNAVVAQYDDFCQHSNNYYLLYSPATHKWVFITYDLDHIMKSGEGYEYYSVVDWTAGGVTLGQKIMANPTWADLYKQYVRDLTDPAGTLFTPNAVESRLNTLQGAISAAGIGTPVFTDSLSLVIGGTAVSTLKDFVTARQAQAVSEVGTNP